MSGQLGQIDKEFPPTRGGAIMTRAPSTALRFCLGAAIAAAAVTAKPDCRAEDLPNYLVLAVGINRYRDPKIPDLRGAVNDAQRISTLLAGQGARSRVTKLLDERATGWDIQRALEQLESQAQPDDCVVVFLSGHGVRKNGDWEFAPSDRFLDGLGDRKVDFIPGVPVTAQNILWPIRKLLGRGQRVFVIIDACQAGQIARVAFSDPAYREGK